MRGTAHGNSLRAKIALTLAYAALVWLLCRWGVPCLFQAFLHLPCPGCGMTRALLAVLRGDGSAALRYHPMIVAMPLLYVYFLTDGKLFGKIADRIILIGIAAGFALHWIAGIILCLI